MTDAERELRLLALKLYGRTDFDDSILVSAYPGGKPRELCCTPYEGAYGVAGHVVAVNGSPPRGTFVTTAYDGVVYINAEGKSRKIPEGQADIVHAFVDEQTQLGLMLPAARR